MNLLERIRFDEQQFAPLPERAHFYSKQVATGYDRMRESTVMIAGLARSIANILPATMLRIELLGKTFADYRVLVYENDSNDNTLDLLKAWRDANPRVDVVSETLGAPLSRPVRCASRADRMSYYRGQCQAAIADRYASYQYVILIDLDLEGGWSPDGIASTFGHDGWDFVGSNGLIYKRIGWQINATRHYDAWAYREHDDFRPLTTKYVHRLRFERGQDLVPLPSCFGGLGVYRTEAYLAGRYEGGDIEHTSFHRSMRQKGFDRTYLNPSQIVLYGRKKRRWDRCVKFLQRSAELLTFRPRTPWRFDDEPTYQGVKPHFWSPQGAIAIGS